MYKANEVSVDEQGCSESNVGCIPMKTPRRTASHRRLPEPTAWASPGTLLEMQILKYPPQTYWWEACSGSGLSNPCFSSLAGDSLAHWSLGTAGIEHATGLSLERLWDGEAGVIVHPFSYWLRLLGDLDSLAPGLPWAQSEQGPLVLEKVLRRRSWNTCVLQVACCQCTQELSTKAAGQLKRLAEGLWGGAATESAVCTKNSVASIHVCKLRCI